MSDEIEAGGNNWSSTTLAVASSILVVLGIVFLLVSGPLRDSLLLYAPIVGIALRYVGMALLVIGVGIWISMWRKRTRGQ